MNSLPPPHPGSVVTPISPGRPQSLSPSCLSMPITSVCLSSNCIPVLLCPSLLPLMSLHPNQTHDSCRVAIAQHLPCLGVLLRVSGQRRHPSFSYHSTHRSTLSSHSSDLSWISGRKRQESLGSESEVVSPPLASTSPFLSQPALGTWT